MRMIDFALGLVERGFAVIPLQPRTKRAFTANGVYDASRDVAMVKAWWTTTPGANVGVPLGEINECWVLDIDKKEGRDGPASLAGLVERHGPLPSTLVVRTGSGQRHYYFRLPKHRPFKNRSDFLPGLEARGEGQYVVGPGSIHPETKKRYEIETDASIADAPDWLLDLIVPPPPSPAAPAQALQKDAEDTESVHRANVSRAVVAKLGATKAGQRNQALNQAAFTLGGLGLSQAEVERELWEATQHWVGEPPESPFTRTEFQKTCASGWRAGQRRALPDRPRVASKKEPDSKKEPTSKKESKERPNWRTRLEFRYDRNGVELGPKSTKANVNIIFSCDEDLEGVLGWNALAGVVQLDRPPPWRWPKTERTYPCPLDDELDVEFASIWLQESHGVSVNNPLWIWTGIRVAAKVRNNFNPLTAWLNSLKWDGKSRLDYWLSDFLGAEDSRYTRAVASKFCIGAVARGFGPGEKVDNVLVLQGPQGIGKSTAFAIMGGPFYKDDKIDLNSSFSALDLRGRWIIELAELASLRGKEYQTVRAWVTKTVDRYRPPYGRDVIEQPRTCILCGTVNESEYLEDPTGARRWWTVKVKKKLDAGGLRELRDQYWAEAVARYRAGEKWYLNTLGFEPITPAAFL